MLGSLTNAVWVPVSIEQPTARSGTLTVERQDVQIVESKDEQNIEQKDVQKDARI